MWGLPLPSSFYLQPLWADDLPGQCGRASGAGFTQRFCRPPAKGAYHGPMSWMLGTGGWTVKRNRPLLVILAVLVVSATVAVLLWPKRDQPQSKLIVAVSVPPQAYFVERLGAERVSVTAMIPPGASPATYEPSAAQVRALGQASIYVKVGHPVFPFEQTWLAKMLSRHKLAVVDCSRGIAVLDDDPHLWLSPQVAKNLADQLLQQLIAVDAQGADLYRQNHQRLVREIEQLDSELKTQLQVVKGGRFIVFHPAWGYFARDYGLQQVALEHHHKEPGAGDLKELVEHAKREKIRLVVVQSGFDKRAASRLASEIGATVVELDPLAKDWPTNLRLVARVLSQQLGAY